jgi:hypothetical protein
VTGRAGAEDEDDEPPPPFLFWMLARKTVTETLRMTTPTIVLMSMTVVKTSSVNQLAGR